jgi:hypothetical protein
MRTGGARWVVSFALLLMLGVSAAPQTEKRRKQIEGLIKRSDLVVHGVSQAYYPIINMEKYQLERAAGKTGDPRRRSKYTVATVYKMVVKEVLYQKPQKDPNKPQRPFYPNDTIIIYAPGPAAHPLDFGKVAFLPGAEYLIFLKKTDLDPGDFPAGVRQDVNAPMAEWESFPNAAETYFRVINDPMAAKLVDEVWQKFVDDTRTVANQMRSPEQ